MSSEYGLRKLVFKGAVQGRNYELGTVVVTPPFRLSPLCRYLFHVVVSPLPSTSKDKYDTLRKLYWRILDEAHKLQVQSIAIPSLGTSTSQGIRITESVSIVIQTVQQWIPDFCRFPNLCHLKTIKFVLNTFGD